MSYDRAITVFSPDGHLFQVEYAMEAVKQGASAIAIKCNDCIIFGAELRSPAKLQKKSSVKKILEIDDHLVCVCAGLTADARVLINRARIEAQSYRLQNEQAPPPLVISRFIAELQQQYTVRGGRRPFGLACLIGGHHPYITDAQHVQLYQTLPSGVYTEWKANAIGRKDKMLNEFLEKHYKENMTEEQGIKLAVRCLLEVVEHGAKNIDIGILATGKKLRKLDEKNVNELVEEIQKAEEEDDDDAAMDDSKADR
mmetsp:Transcript_21791/g.34979  ORF Transcript_21791/g.34979 Transcript_21791/m.34979 type:complete len:255 (-) Transcript_21791:245-1009(-)|eukprot:CAMPEP_0197031184 /NCGR_PEP_ID=MMETSP1384-20130603/10261_1 /TAXON_ID=29189 /ORGANISM="Ammonia sp." /LENGTH=254 /DNA_ID=CAMNT_0042460677 /DNA_START=40 /DNA_END=804 /DNA_ORIENTATION=-